MIEFPESFVTHKFLLKAKSGETILLIPFGDIHMGNPQCAVERWDEFVEWTKTKGNAFYLGMGDYLDALSGSERKVLAPGAIHDTTYEDLEKFYKDRLDKFAKQIAHLRGRIIGLHEGNHHFKFESGITSTQYLCGKLHTRYLGNVAFTKLVILTRGSSNRLHCVIFSAHGLVTSGRTVSGGMNQIERMEPVAEADIYLMGHNHQKGALPFARLHLIDTSTGEMKVVQRKGFYVRTGSFLKAYSPNERSYAANRLYRPTDLGVVRIELTPRRTLHRKGDGKRTDLLSLDIHVSV